MEIVVIDRTNSILLRAAFTDQLRQKSRHRRDRQERLATTSAARPRRNDILPRLELSDIRIADLRPSPRKVRKLDPAHVREVASSISALGFCVPLLVGRDNEIIHGEVRYEAAKQLGLDRLPCVRVGHLSPEEQRVLRQGCAANILRWLDNAIQSLRGLNPERRTRHPACKTRL
jgi:hypothetical protein